MSDRSRIRIAAAATALFLAVMSAAGLAARDHRPTASAAPSVQPTAATPPVTTPDNRIYGSDEREDDE